MALRPARIYRKKPKNPYTRQAKRKEKNYIRGAPAPRISIFEMGNSEKKFEKRVVLRIKEECSIRSNALEAARIAANAYLKNNVGIKNYYLKIKVYPHHVLRYHPLAGVAQADRYYQGMSKPFGRPTGRAALVNKNQEIIVVGVDEENVGVAKQALKRAGMKFSRGVKISVE